MRKDGRDILEFGLECPRGAWEIHEVHVVCVLLLRSEQTQVLRRKLVLGNFILTPDLVP